MFDTSDMQPSPPLAIKASAVASSPDNSRNPGGSSGCKRIGRVTSPVPSLNPMNCDDCASRASVSSDSSRMVREGTSCRIMGRRSCRRSPENARICRPASACCNTGTTESTASAPAASARRVSSIAWLVEFDPAPAIDADATACDFDGGADDAVVLDRRQRGGFAGGFADDDRGDFGFDLAFAKFCECRQIEISPLSSKGVGRSGM